MQGRIRKSGGIARPAISGGQSKSLRSYWATLISATVENAVVSNVVLTFPDAKDLVAADFTCTVNGVARTINSGSWTGAALTLVLASAVIYGDVVVITFVKSGGTKTVTNNVAAEAELSTYITGLATPLSTTQLIRLNTFIKGLKSGLSVSNLSDVFDTIYVLGGETSESSLKNLVKNAHHAQQVNANVFEQYVGFASNGTNSYLKLNYNANTEGLRYTLDSASFGVYCAEKASVTGARAMGSRVGYGDDMSYMVVNSGGSGAYFINQDSTAGTATVVTDSRASWIVSRTASDSYKIYRNKIELLSETLASTAIPNYEWFGLAANAAGSPSGYDTRKYGLMFTGKGFSATEIAAINDAWDEYRANIYYVGQTFSNGKLLIYFDDNTTSQYSKLYPILQQKNAKATFYVVGNWVGTGGSCTWAQLIEMESFGVDMQCHTIDHTALAAVDEATVLSKLNENTNAFVSNGLISPLHLTYPEGSVNDNVKTWVSTLRLTGRNAYGGLFFDGVSGKNVDKYNIRSKVLTGGIGDIDEFKKLLDIAQRQKLSFGIYGHILVDTDIEVIDANYATTALMSGIIDYAQQIGVEIVTISELYPLLD